MKLELNLLILFLLALGSSCTGERLQLTPRQVCEVVDQIEELKGQRVVVQGILSWEDRHGTMGLFDCRPHLCPDFCKYALQLREAPEGAADDSFDRMMRELPKQPINQMIVTLEGMLQVEHRDLSLLPGGCKETTFIVIVVSKVKSMKPVRMDGRKRSDYCY